MVKKLQYRRLVLLALLLSAAFGGLAYRLVDLQVLRHEEWTKVAEHKTQREFLLEPRRGDILDCQGNLLATTVLVKNVCADPSLLGSCQAEVAHALAPWLQMNEAALAQALMPRLRRNAQGQIITNQYVCLKRKVPVETWEHIKAAMTNLSFGLDEKKLARAKRAFYRVVRQKAIFARDAQQRVYPNQCLAAHVLGFVNTEEREIEGKPVTEIRGLNGIELTFNSKLAGVRGWRQTETDGRGREVVALREQNVEARDGFNVVLTIDSFIQQMVESALAEAMKKYSPKSVSGIVVRPRTGEILALATLPAFDPNDPGNRNTTADARRDRVLTDVVEPGSTFKTVSVSAALDAGVVRLTEPFDCEHGLFRYGGYPLHDAHPSGVLTVEQILTHSSNIGAAKIGIRLGAARLYDYIRKYGFGERTGIPLPAEASGIVHPVSDWSKVSIARIPMGQGIAVTRLQMTMAVCAIANHGWLMRPMLVDRLEDSDHRLVANYSPQYVRQVIGDTAAKQMIQALKTVVSPEGTAPKAAMEHYTVAGKTGTAQKVEGGHYVRRYFCSFIGFFPADHPELCISVMLDDPDPKKGYYGGQVAAPIFKDIAERAANYLNIRPDDAEVTQGSEPLLVPSPANNHLLRTAAARSQ